MWVGGADSLLAAKRPVAPPTKVGTPYRNAMPTPPVIDIDRRYQLLGLKIVSEFGAAIAVPVVVATSLGKRLDTAYGTGPVFVIAGFTFAAAVSAAYVARRARAYSKEYDAINEATRRPGDAKARAPEKRS